MNKLRHLWRFLTTPLAQDDDAALRERWTRIIFVMVSAGLLLMTIIIPAFDFTIGEPSLVPTFVMLAINSLMAIGWYLILRGRWTISRYLLPMIFIALGVYFTFIVGPITTGVLQFAIAILLTAMLLGNKAQWIVVLICEVLYLTVGWLSGERDFEIFFTGGIVVGVSLSGIALLQWFASSILVTSFKRLRQAEAASRAAAGKMRAIFDSISDGITITDLQGTITDLNEATAHLHGFENREDLIGRSAFELIAERDHRTAEKNMLGTLTEGNSGILEYTLVTKDGTGFEGELNAVLIKDEASHPVGFVALTRDISPRKQAVAEREALIRQLQSKNTELEQFTYTVSHDLKAPLITISGFLGYLEQDATEGDVERVHIDVQNIKQAVDRMQLLLNELLELSRIGRLAEPPREVSFDDIVQEALKHVQGRLSASRADVRVAPNLPVVYGDRNRLVEVVQNLVDNAAKFMGEQPSPLIEIGTCGEDAERGKTIFFIRDNGIGILPKHQERIFGLFHKLDPQGEGTGIGLAIVKKIVEVHGGRVWVEGEIGKGSTFYFTLQRGEHNYISSATGNAMSLRAFSPDADHEK